MTNEWTLDKSKGGDDVSDMWNEYNYRHSHIWRIVIQATTVIVALGALPHLPDSKVPNNLDWIPAAAAALLAALTFFRLRREFHLFDSVKEKYLKATSRWDAVERGKLRHRFFGFRNQVGAYHFALLFASLFNLGIVGPLATPDVASGPYPGLVVDGDTLLRQELISHIDKCQRDSATFLSLLKDLKRRTSGTGKTVRLVANATTGSLIGHGGQLGEMFVDLSDLVRLADPIDNGQIVSVAPLRRGFVPLPGRPPWASTVCSWLGHEIAAMLEDIIDGTTDRPVHHYQIAISIEDGIVRDYYGISRNRGEDCFVAHNGHNDVLIQIGRLGVERYHMSPQIVRFGKPGDPPRAHDPGRLAHIEYEVGTTFPGRKASSTECDI